MTKAHNQRVETDLRTRSRARLLSLRVRHPRSHHTMRRIHFKGFLLGTLLSGPTFTVRAGDWPGPQTKEVFSASREYFVRVMPGERLGDTLGFAREKQGKDGAAG